MRCGYCWPGERPHADRSLKQCRGKKSIVQWDQKGHFLAWTVDLPAAGRYHLLVRGHATDETVRRLWPNDVEVGPIVFLATRGLGDLAFAG